MSTNVVAWSGGFDSTLVLLKLLEDEPDNDLIVISCYNSITGQAKCDREKSARTKIKEYIKLRYSNVKITYLTVNVSIDDNYLRSNNKGLAQPIFWITSMIPFIPDNSVLHFGYIKSDEAIMNKEDIYQSVNHLARFQDKSIKVDIPLISMSKTDVLKTYFSKYPDLLELCTSCENLYSSDKCCNCIPCKNMINALTTLYLDNDYGSEAAFMLQKYYNIEV